MDPAALHSADDFTKEGSGSRSAREREFEVGKPAERVGDVCSEDFAFQASELTSAFCPWDRYRASPSPTEL